MSHPLLPGMQATHGIPQGGCSVAGQLTNQISTATSFPLLSLLSVKNVLAVLNLFFRLVLLCLKSLSLIPWLLLSQLMATFFFNNSGFGANALPDSFRYSVHTAPYVHIPVLSVVAIQAIWPRWRSVQALSCESTLVCAQGLKQRDSKLLSFQHHKPSYCSQQINRWPHNIQVTNSSVPLWDRESQSDDSSQTLCWPAQNLLTSPGTRQLGPVVVEVITSVKGAGTIANVLCFQNGRNLFLSPAP